MRLRHLMMWDVKCQVKYGFYLLYVLLTALYVILLRSLPEAWRGIAATLLIFSDPAAMGLFFMGAIVLLEKSQRVPCALAVSPMQETEYLISKVISLGIIALLVSAILSLQTETLKLPYVLLGTALSEILFTLSGIILATGITSLNQFLLWTVPIEILGFVPAILHSFHLLPAIGKIYPPNVCIDIIMGNAVSPVGLLGVIGLILVLFWVAKRCVRQMWEGMGGVKL